MKKTLMPITLGLMFIVINSFAAVKIVECEDENGNRSYDTSCPPGTTLIQEKEYKTKSTKGENNETSIDATIYIVNDCDYCDVVREFLQKRNVNITEKNITDNVNLQNELKEAAGKLIVPFTVIGEAKLEGYDRNELQKALENAGYVEKENPGEETKEGV